MDTTGDVNRRHFGIPLVCLVVKSGQAGRAGKLQVLLSEPTLDLDIEHDGIALLEWTHRVGRTTQLWEMMLGEVRVTDTHATYTYTQTHAHTLTHRHTHKHPHTLTHTGTHTHTHTHTVTQEVVLYSGWKGVTSSWNDVCSLRVVWCEMGCGGACAGAWVLCVCVNKSDYCSGLA